MRREDRPELVVGAPCERSAYPVHENWLRREDVESLKQSISRGHAFPRTHLHGLELRPQGHGDDEL